MQNPDPLILASTDNVQAEEKYDVDAEARSFERAVGADIPENHYLSGWRLHMVSLRYAERFRGQFSS